MRHLLLSVPVLALSACSFLTGGDGYSDAYYGGCDSSCSSGHSYSVAETNYSQPTYEAPATTYQSTTQYAAPQSPSVAYHTQPTQSVHQTQPNQYYYNDGFRGMHKAKRSAYKYGDLGVIAYDVNDGGFGLVGRAGYQSSGLLGAEVEGTLAFKDQDFTQGTSEVSGGPDYSLGAFAVARLPITPKISAHARGGYHFTNIDSVAQVGAAAATLDSDTVDGFAYGGGAEYALNERDSLRLDYTRYEYDEVINGITYDGADSLALAYNRRF
ncbi:outer membrane protein with beta-barrel domain [Litorimonas taeanensis]|uniref:Outer membrane protein with beta-barrel domain n=1 Tax=Litorimonas taeanensis TaxID=568099 RepID=A0A420WM39_9PROT|nr:outer membrane beta-barrel protein [Litorimonas taeanensis]RKQ72111.1 outer membrane protein with beta-barrel domain [Litorimonas taeanensis]